MRMRLRLLVVVSTSTVLAIGFLVAAGSGNAADDTKEVRQNIEKIADVMEKNDMAAAKKQAEALPKDLEADDIMSLFSMRKAKGGGIGIGSKAGAIKPDGIEAKI